MKKTRLIYVLLSLINLAAILIAIYLTIAHFKPELSDFCVLGESWNCDIVNKSIYSVFLGVPVAILGLLAYISFFIFSIRGLFVDQKKLLPYFTGAVAISTLFALYLTGIETFVLRTYCIFCVTQQVLILIELGLSIRLLFLTRPHEKTS